MACELKEIRICEKKKKHGFDIAKKYMVSEDKETDCEKQETISMKLERNSV